MAGRGYAFVLALVALPACGGGRLARRRDTSAGFTGCAPQEIVIEDGRVGLSTETWTAVCRGRRFQCAGVGRQWTCTPEPDAAEDSADAVETSIAGPSATSPPAVAEPPPATAPTAAAAVQGIGPAVQRVAVEGDTGASVITLRARIRADDFTLAFRAEPRVSEQVTFAMLRPAALVVPNCAVGFMVDGELQSFPQPQLVRDGSDRGYRAAISLDTLRRMSLGTRVVGRVCEREWRIDPAGLAALQELVARIDEERAWQAGTGEAEPQSPTPP